MIKFLHNRNGKQKPTEEEEVFWWFSHPFFTLVLVKNSILKLILGPHWNRKWSWQWIVLVRRRHILIVVLLMLKFLLLRKCDGHINFCSDWLFKIITGNDFSFRKSSLVLQNSELRILRQQNQSFFYPKYQQTLQKACRSATKAVWK